MKKLQLEFFRQVIKTIISCVIFCYTAKVSAQSLIVYVNTLDGKRSNIDAMSYYNSHKGAIELAYSSTDDQKARHRFLFEMAMRCKTLAEDPKYSPDTKEHYRAKTKMYLNSYIQWFNELDDSQLKLLPPNETTSELMEIRHGRIQTVTEFLLYMLFEEGKYGEIKEQIEDFPTIVYLNKKSLNTWKKSIKAANSNADSTNKCFEIYWVKYREWAKQFPLRETNRTHYLEEAEVALASINKNA